VIPAAEYEMFEEGNYMRQVLSVEEQAAPEHLSPAELRAMHTSMQRIRTAEERLAEMVISGEVKCPCHLYIGQEAVAVGVCSALRRDDYIFGNHRSHGHYLAKGGSLPEMYAEILGRTTGCSHGRGGSMHLIAPEVGLMGTSAMVATGLPLAVGAAIAFRMRGSDQVVAVFFGDGAAEEGAFFESLNLAALRKAPVIFVCENNLYSSHIHIRDRRPADNIAEAARASCIPATIIDGNDVLATYRAAVDAVARARAGEGPTFVECRTYRWRGHVGSNWDLDKGLRTREEVEEWVARCPIKSFEERLMSTGVLNEEEIIRTRERVAVEIEQAIAFARQSPFPQPNELLNNLFQQGPRYA
jgi:acetoin:2,6-dichlorophenolindophenol oxidoreductase subunit alpha